MSIVLIVAGVYALYTTYGVSTPYHDDKFPGMSSQDVELSSNGELVEIIAHYCMYMLDLGVPIFAIWVTHHLLMTLRALISGNEGHYD